MINIRPNPRLSSPLTGEDKGGGENIVVILEYPTAVDLLGGLAACDVGAVEGACLGLLGTLC